MFDYVTDQYLVDVEGIVSHAFPQLKKYYQTFAVHFRSIPKEKWTIYPYIGFCVPHDLEITFQGQTLYWEDFFDECRLEKILTLIDNKKGSKEDIDDKEEEVQETLRFEIDILLRL